MHAAEGVGHHELSAQQPHPVDRQGSDPLGLLREGQVDVDPGTQRGNRRCVGATATPVVT